MKFYEDIIRKPVLSEKTYDMIEIGRASCRERV